MFIDAPGVTGKTFLLNLILAKIHISGTAIALSSSGIAATLLHGGRTAHSTFKLPLNLKHTESPVCNIARGSGLALLLQCCQFIVWDECTMSHKGALEAVDCTLHDLRHADRLIGSITLLLSGDFRQTLPVIPRGTPADELKACLKSSYPWQHIKMLHLQTNMCVGRVSPKPKKQTSSMQLVAINGCCCCVSVFLSVCISYNSYGVQYIWTSGGQLHSWLPIAMHLISYLILFVNS